MTAALLALGTAALADIGVTTAARIVADSGSIIVGDLALRDGKPVVVPVQVLKGPAMDGPIPLIDPTESQFLAFNLEALVKDAAGSRAVILGDRNDLGLVLTQIYGSIWPQAHQPGTFPSRTLDQCVAFIQRLLHFSAISTDPDALAYALFLDISGRGENPPHAALAYLEVAVDADLKAPLPGLLRALGMATAAGNRQLDAAALDQLSILAPDLPPSIAAPFFLDRSRREQGDAARIAHNALWPILSAYGDESLGPDSGSDALEFALAPLLSGFRKDDARTMLQAYDLGLPRLSTHLADSTMRAILGRTPEGDLDDMTPAERRRAWSLVIAALR